MSQKNAIPTLALADKEKAKLTDVLRTEIPPYNTNAYEEFFLACHRVSKLLSPDVLTWRDMTQDYDIGILKNLPLDTNMPATPTLRNIADTVPMLSEAVLGVISVLFGTLYTIQGKGSGRHIHNIYPVLGDEYTQLGTGSKANLDWHVEEAFHPRRPTWLALFCIRGDSSVVTKLARARDLHLSPHFESILRQPRFKLLIDETYSGQSLPPFVTSAVLDGPASNPTIVLDPAYTIFEHEDEAQAVAEVIHAAEQAHEKVVLVEGDLLIFNNHRVIHGRNAFVPRMDGTDRWVKRAFILQDSLGLSKITNGVIPFEF